MEIKLIDEKEGRAREISLMAKQLKDLTDRADGDVSVKDNKIKFLEESLKNQERRLADDL
jgi:hypothetical protein